MTRTHQQPSRHDPQSRDSPLVLGNFWIDEFPVVRSKTHQCSGLVLAHQTTVASHIGGEDGCNSAFYPLLGQDHLPSGRICADYAGESTAAGCKRFADDQTADISHVPDISPLYTDLNLLVHFKIQADRVKMRCSAATSVLQVTEDHERHRVTPRIAPMITPVSPRGDRIRPVRRSDRAQVVGLLNPARPSPPPSICQMRRG